MTVRQKSRWRRFLPHLRGGVGLLVLVGLLSGCSGTGDKVPELPDIPDAVPKVEPKSKYGNPKSYVVFGKRYYTKASSKGHVERGPASWYGKKFHGRKTSNGERYNMYAMTAAHKTLPLPTYVRVINLTNGRSTVVRVNDRGPFHGNRIIDLSYSAARKLGMAAKGVEMVEIRTIDPNNPKSDRQDGFLASADDTFATKIKARRPKTRKTGARKKAVARKTPAVAKPARRAEKTVTRMVKTKRPGAPPINTSGRVADTAEPPTPEPKVAVFTPRKKSGQTPRSLLYLQVGAFGSHVNAEHLRRRLVNRIAEQVRIRTLDDNGTPWHKVQVGPLASQQSARDLSRQLASLGLKGSHVVVE